MPQKIHLIVWKKNNGNFKKTYICQKTKWASKGFSDAEVKTIVELAKISVQIEQCQLDKGMTQKEFDKIRQTLSILRKYCYIT